MIQDENLKKAAEKTLQDTGNREITRLITYTGQDKLTPLNTAYQWSNFRLVKKYSNWRGQSKLRINIEHNAPLREDIAPIENPLIRQSSESEILKTVHTLIRGGADVNFATTKPPLQGAVIRRSLTVAQLLIRSGANVNQLWEQGYSHSRSPAQEDTVK